MKNRIKILVIIFFILFFCNCYIYSQDLNWIKLEDFKKYSENDAKKYLDKMIPLKPGYSKIYRYILILRSDQKKYFELWDQVLNKKSAELKEVYLANSLITSFFINKTVMIDYFYEFGIQYLPEDDKALFDVLYKSLTLNLYGEEKLKEFEEILLNYFKIVEGLLDYSILYLYQNENLINVIIKNADKLNITKYNDKIKNIFRTAKNFFLIESLILYFNKYDSNYLIDSLYFLLSHRDINVNVFALELSIRINIFDKLNPESYKKILYNNDIGFVVSVFSRLLSLRPGNKKLEDILLERYNSLPDSLKSSFVPLFNNFVHIDKFIFFIDSYKKTSDETLKTELKKLLLNHINSKNYNREGLIYFLTNIRDIDEPFFSEIAFNFLNYDDISVKTEALYYFYFYFDERNKDFAKRLKNKLYELILKEENDKFVDIWFLVVSRNNFKDIYIKSFNEFFNKIKTTENNYKLLSYIKYIEYFQTPEIFLTIINSKIKLSDDSIKILDSIFKKNLKLFNDDLIEKYLQILKKSETYYLLNDYLIINDRISNICLNVIRDYKKEIFIPNLIFLLQKDEKISSQASDILLKYNLKPYLNNIFNVVFYENVNYLKSIIKIIYYKQILESEYLGTFVYLLSFHKDDNVYILLKEFFLNLFRNYNIKDDNILNTFYSIGINSIEILNEALLIYTQKKDYNKVLIIINILSKFKDPSTIKYLKPIFEIENKVVLQKILQILNEFDCREFVDKLINIYNKYKDDYFIKQNILRIINKSYVDNVKGFVLSVIEDESFELKKLGYDVIKNNGNIDYIDYLLKNISDKYSYEALQSIYNRLSDEDKEKLKTKLENNKIDFLLFLISGLKKGNINPKNFYTLNTLLKNYNKVYRYISYENEEELKNLIPLILASDMVDIHFNKINSLFSSRRQLIDLLSFGLLSNNSEKQFFSRNLIIKYKYNNVSEILNFLKVINRTNYEKYSYLICLDKDFSIEMLNNFINEKSRENIINLLMVLRNSDIKEEIILETSKYPYYFLVFDSDFLGQLEFKLKNDIFNNLIKYGNLNSNDLLFYVDKNFENCYLEKENLIKVLDHYIDLKPSKNDDNNLRIFENIVIKSVNYNFYQDPEILKNKKVEKFFEKYKYLNKNKKNLAIDSLSILKDYRFAYFFKDIKEDTSLITLHLMNKTSQSVIIYFLLLDQNIFYNSIEKINKLNVENINNDFLMEVIKITNKVENIILFLTKFDYKIFEDHIFNEQIFNKLKKQQIVSIFISYQRLIDFNIKKSNLVFLKYLNNYFYDELFAYSYLRKFKKVDYILFSKILDFINVNKLENIKKVINVIVND
ncbi:MAG: hypothetical protein N3A58_08620 [Spirochaetes bacterium]|nr:hypothetical protein [Spirochaetota bacterium]